MRNTYRAGAGAAVAALGLLLTACGTTVKATSVPITPAAPSSGSASAPAPAPTLSADGKPAVIAGRAPTLSPTSPVQSSAAPLNTPGQVAKGSMPAPAVVSAKAGDVLTSLPGALPGALHAFPLPGGTYVVVDPASPLPSAAQSAAQARAGSIPVVTSYSDKAALAANGKALSDLATWVDQSSGKRVIVVEPAPPIVGADSSQPQPAWTAWTQDPSTKATTSFTKLSAAEALSGLQSYLSAHGQDPSSYVVVNR